MSSPSAPVNTPPPPRLVRRWAWLPLTACIVLLAVAIGNARRDTEALRTEWQRLEANAVARRAAHPATAPKRPVAVTEPLAEPGSAAANTAASGKSDTAASKSKLPSGVLTQFSDTNALGDPDYAATIARRQRRYAMGRNRHAIESLHLTAADTARLKELVAERDLDSANAADVLDRMGGTGGDLRGKAGAAARADAEASIKALLGPEKYAEFQTQNAISATTQTSWAMFADFWDAGVPLTNEQKAALAQTMVETGASPYVAAATTGRPPSDESNQRLLTAAAAFLSPDQLAFLRTYQASEAQYRQAQNPRHP